MPALACLNGVMGPIEEAKVSVWDRGFTFGDSVYEVFRLYQGRPWLEDEHYARLKNSLLQVEFPPVDLSKLRETVDRTVALSEVAEGTVYIQITRGVAPRAHPFPNPPVAPTEVIVVRPYDDSATARLRESGVVAVCRPDQRWGRRDVKSTNLLANVLALEIAHRSGAYEAILVGDDGYVSEATHSSLLWVRAGTLHGTPEGFEILPGTKRHFIERLAADAGIKFGVERIAQAELLLVDEILLSGTSIEVLPVIRVDDTTIGKGQPGPVARQLRLAYRAAVDDWLKTPQQP